MKHAVIASGLDPEPRLLESAIFCWLRVELLDPSCVIPLHPVRDDAFFERLIMSMAIHGWVGAPLVGFVTRSGDVQAMNGSHRISAARLAGLAAIPIRVVSRRRMEQVERRARKNGERTVEISLIAASDDQRLAVLQRYGLSAAASCMRREISAKTLAGAPAARSSSKKAASRIGT